MYTYTLLQSLSDSVGLLSALSVSATQPNIVPKNDSKSGCPSATLYAVKSLKIAISCAFAGGGGGGAWAVPKSWTRFSPIIRGTRERRKSVVLIIVVVPIIAMVYQVALG